MSSARKVNSPAPDAAFGEYQPPATRLRRMRQHEAAIRALTAGNHDEFLEADIARLWMAAWWGHSILTIPAVHHPSTAQERARARCRVARADWSRRRNIKRRVSSRFRRIAIERAQGRCAYCGRTMPEGGDPDRFFDIDHIFPVCRGGRSVLRNLIAACWECNREKQGDIWEPLYYPPGFRWPSWLALPAR